MTRLTCLHRLIHWVNKRERERWEHLLEVFIEVCEALLASLNHLGQLLINIVLRALNVKVWILHPLFLQWLRSNGGCGRSYR